MQEKTSNPLAIIIEDEEQLALIYSKALEMAGYETLALYDGQEAMDYLARAEKAAAMITLDLHLPGLSGEEILRFIRSDPRYNQTRVILATSDSASVVGEIEKKSDIVLLKPISFTQLRELASRFRR